MHPQSLANLLPANAYVARTRLYRRTFIIRIHLDSITNTIKQLRVLRVVYSITCIDTLKDLSNCKCIFPNVQTIYSRFWSANITWQSKWNLSKYSPRQQDVCQWVVQINSVRLSLRSNRSRKRKHCIKYSFCWASVLVLNATEPKNKSLRTIDTTSQ